MKYIIQKLEKAGAFVNATLLLTYNNGDTQAVDAVQIPEDKFLENPKHLDTVAQGFQDTVDAHAEQAKAQTEKEVKVTAILAELLALVGKEIVPESTKVESAESTKEEIKPVDSVPESTDPK